MSSLWRRAARPRGATLGVGVHVGVHVVRVARGEVPLVASPRSRASFARAVAARHHRARLSARPRAMPSRDGGDSLDDEFAVAETDPDRPRRRTRRRMMEEEEENETRVFRDAAWRRTTTSPRGSRTCSGTYSSRDADQMPIGHFRLPADASVGANVFSESIAHRPGGADAPPSPRRASPAASRTSTSASAPSSPPPSPCRCSSRWCR